MEWCPNHGWEENFEGLKFGNSGLKDKKNTPTAPFIDIGVNAESSALSSKTSTFEQSKLTDKTLLDFRWSSKADGGKSQRKSNDELHFDLDGNKENSKEKSWKLD